MTSSENNKRIAKNTLFLYFRSILTLGIGLYTSREVLAQLGVSDFGIYHVVAGVLGLFSFIQYAMSGATGRFLTFDLGLGDFDKLRKSFSLSVVIHIFTALIILILGETFGLWFLNHKLVIPAERMGAANFVYQFSVLAACIGILQVPYMTAIHAHERMKVYAYASIADAAFKLAVAITLGLAPFDKLKFYSVFLFTVYIIMAIFYQIYCLGNFPETRFKWFWDKKMFLERIGFSGWNVIQSITSISAAQGINMLLNMFFGVIVNAAYGVMNQVNNAINQLTYNFIASASPQIIKNYAQNNLEAMNVLLFRVIKFTVLLNFILSMPLVINMDFVLNTWLKEAPPYASFFCKIVLVNSMLGLFFRAIHVAIQASGKIKKFILVDSIFIASQFVSCFILFSCGFSPNTVPVVYITADFIRIVGIYFFAKLIFNFPVLTFLKKVPLRLLSLPFVCLPLPIFISFHLTGIHAFLATSITLTLLYIPCAYFVVLEKTEREFILQLVKNKLRFRSN